MKLDDGVGSPGVFHLSVAENRLAQFDRRKIVEFELDGGAKLSWLEHGKDGAAHRPIHKGSNYAAVGYSRGGDVFFSDGQLGADPALGVFDVFVADLRPPVVAVGKKCSQFLGKFCHIFYVKEAEGKDQGDRELHIRHLFNKLMQFPLHLSRRKMGLAAVTG